MYIRAYENSLKSKTNQRNQSTNKFMITTARSNFRAIAKHRALQKINSQIKNQNFQANASNRIYNESFYQLQVSPYNKPNKHELKNLPNSTSIEKLSASINIYHSQELSNQREKKIKKLLRNSYIGRPISVQCRLVRKDSTDQQSQNQNYFQLKPQLVLDLSKTLRQRTPESKMNRIRIKRNQSLNPEVHQHKIPKKPKNNRSFIVKNIIKQIDKTLPAKRMLSKQKVKDDSSNDQKKTIQRVVNTEIQKINPWVVQKQVDDWDLF